MAPIHGLAVLEGGGLEPLRPDAMPELPESRGHLIRISAFSLLAAGSLAYLAHLRGILGFDRQGRHFREARRTLRRLKREHESQEIMKAGFATVHRAFDRSLGEPLFAERLPRFFSENACYAGLRSDIEGFFHASYQFFFGDTGSETEYGIDRLDSLCAACLLAERSRR
jgi:mxaA protein